MDETYIKVEDTMVLLVSCEPSRALVNVLFSEHRDRKAARTILPLPPRSQRALSLTGSQRTATTAIPALSAPSWAAECTIALVIASRYLTNRLEQNHRGIKGRYWPMLTSARDQQLDPAKDTTSYETSSGPVPITTSMFPPIVAECATSVERLRCWRSWKRLAGQTAHLIERAV